MGGNWAYIGPLGPKRPWAPKNKQIIFEKIALGPLGPGPWAQKNEKNVDFIFFKKDAQRNLAPGPPIDRPRSPFWTPIMNFRIFGDFGHLVCLQTRHLLCLQTRNLLCCRQEICCVCRPEICCVCRREICGLPRHPNGMDDTGAAAFDGRPLCDQ